jgi:P27 family predicted phage terminase small subunit
MGARGPAPKATNMRILEGNPGRLPINHDEPQPEPGAKCPYWATDGAREVWEEVAPVLITCGILTQADQVMFAAWCDAVANYKLVSAEIEFNTQKSAECDSPVYAQKEIKSLIASQRNYAELMVRFGTKFGLSPGDRTGLKVSKPKERSKWEGRIT